MREHSPMKPSLDGIVRCEACDETWPCEVTRLRAALKPFSDMAGELFSRNWNGADVVVALDNPDDPHRVTANDFFEARCAYQQKTDSK